MGIVAVSKMIFHRIARTTSVAVAASRRGEGRSSDCISLGDTNLLLVTGKYSKRGSVIYGWYPGQNSVATGGSFADSAVAVPSSCFNSVERSYLVIYFGRKRRTVKEGKKADGIFENQLGKGSSDVTETLKISSFQTEIRTILKSFYLEFAPVFGKQGEFKAFPEKFCQEIGHVNFS